MKLNGTMIGGFLLSGAAILLGYGMVEYSKNPTSSAISGMVSGAAALAGSGAGLIVNDPDKDREIEESNIISHRITDLKQELENKNDEILELKIRIAYLEKEIEKEKGLKSLEIEKAILIAENESLKKLLPPSSQPVYQPEIEYTKPIEQESPDVE